MDLAANELLHRSHYILPVNILYFSRPNPDAAISWVYTIVDNGPRRLLLGPNIPQGPHWTTTTRLPFRKLSSVIEAVMDWTLLLRRHRHIKDSANLIFGRSQINHVADEHAFTLVTTSTPGFSNRIGPRNPKYVVEILQFVAHLIHRDREIAYESWFPNVEQFLRRAFFLDSGSPVPVHVGNREYHFKTLQHVLGDDFEGYDIEYVRSKFREFVELVRYEWDQPDPNPAAIPSIVDLIEQREYVLK
jgi:hypothetical protein